LGHWKGEKKWTSELGKGKDGVEATEKLDAVILPSLRLVACWASFLSRTEGWRTLTNARSSKIGSSDPIVV
jgi:hypothetical protein